MKFFHIADLHFGKNVNGFSMISDQRDFVRQLFEAIEAEKPDGVIIAGDVFDRSQPSAEAKKLYDYMLTGLAERSVKIFIISGNHDSADLLAIGSDIFARQGVYISKIYDGTLQKISLQDEYGPVNVYLLPYVTTAVVRAKAITAGDEGGAEQIKTYTDAVRYAIGRTDVNTSERNIILSHQFLTSALTSDSEVTVGTLDNVDVSVYDDFDYVALGHIHRPQKIGRETARYAGSPLKYSKSEMNAEKSICVVDMKEKENTEISFIPVKPLHEMREITGIFDELMDRNSYEGTNCDDYIFVKLLDDTEVLEAVPKLRTVYHNIMGLEYANINRGTTETGGISYDAAERKSPYDMFAEFFEAQNGKQMSGQQQAAVKEIMSEIWEENA